MRRRRRRWRPTAGAVILLVSLLAIAAGIMFGRALIASLDGGTPVASREQAGTGAQSSQTGQGGQTSQTGQSGQPSAGTATGQSSGSGAGSAGTEAQATFDLPAVVTFTVQAGRFDSRSNAENLVAALTKAGYPAWGARTPPYRVFVGMYADKKNAAELAAKLKAERPGDCGEAWTTSIAAPALNKTVSGADRATLTAASTALRTVAGLINQEAALWDARARGTLKSADVKAFVDRCSPEVNKALADLRATSGGDAALRDKAMAVLVAAQGNLTKVNALTSSATNSTYNDAISSLIDLAELYAATVVILTPTGS